MFLLNCVKLFVSINGKTSQQTKFSPLAIAKCWMMSDSTRAHCKAIQIWILNTCHWYPNTSLKGNNLYLIISRRARLLSVSFSVWPRDSQARGNRAENELSTSLWRTSSTKSLRLEGLKNGASKIMLKPISVVLEVRPNKNNAKKDTTNSKKSSESVFEHLN